MMTKAKTKIDIYTVEIEPNQERDDALDCWVRVKNYQASLAALSHTGYLETLDGKQHVVPAWIVNEIEEWAESQGY